MLVATNTGLFRALAHRRFLALWLGQTVSAFGDSLHKLALVWWVMQTAKSGVAIAIVLICLTLPMIAFLLIGGVIVDRFDRIRIMFYSDIARCVLTGIFAYLMFADRLELWHVYIFAVLFGFVASFFKPAYSALVPRLVPSHDLPSANSLGALSTQLASIVGPMIAAIIIAVGQSALAFAIDAGTFAISAVCLVPLLGKVANAEPGEQPSTSMLADLRDGLAYVYREPWLWISILAFLTINLTFGPALAVALPYLITQKLAYNASALGAVDALGAAGTVVGAIWLGRRAGSSRRGLIIYGWVIGCGACMAAMGLPISIYGIAGLAAMMGFGNAIIVLLWTNLMQDRVPPEKLGRVASIDLMSVYIPMPLGMALIGWSTDHISPRVVLAICGGVQIVAAGLALLHPQLRKID